MCHQVIEKVFKGYFTALKNEVPPFRHELDLLAKRGEFYDSLDEKQKSFLDVLSPLNIEARYPEYKARISKALNKDVCKNLYNQVENLQQWTIEKISLTK